MFEKLVCRISVFVFLACLVDPGMPCRKKMPPLGPRLLRAKALFGNFMRECKDLIFAVAKAIPPPKVHEVTERGCRLYNACKPSTNEAQPDVLYDCLNLAFADAVRTFTVISPPLPRGEEIQRAAQNYMVCGVGVAKKYSISLETLDDVMAVAYTAIHSFGWT
ncbi:hypothetical protein MRX96_033515 [Rhipicephalus microplus]